MSAVHFNALDLNLLRVFDALLEERGVTRAGERLGLSQSAISHALNRLRHVLNDELFVRVPEGMRPTPRASEIVPRLREGLLQLQLTRSEVGLLQGALAAQGLRRVIGVTTPHYLAAWRW
jgi:DNA-binding transcriptional LysR family regulator